MLLPLWCVVKSKQWKCISTGCCKPNQLCTLFFWYLSWSSSVCTLSQSGKFCSLSVRAWSSSLTHTGRVSFRSLTTGWRLYDSSIREMTSSSLMCCAVLWWQWGSVVAAPMPLCPCESPTSPNSPSGGQQRDCSVALSLLSSKVQDYFLADCNYSAINSSRTYGPWSTSGVFWKETYGKI